MKDNGPPEINSSSSDQSTSGQSTSQRPPSLQDEIDALRKHMRWLQDAISSSDTKDERVKLGRAYQETGYCLARLLHTQYLLHRDEDSEFDQALNQVLAEITAEWRPS